MSNQDGRLDKIEQGLYSRVKKPADARRHSLSPENRESPLGWAEDKTIPAFTPVEDLNINSISSQMTKPKRKLSAPLIFLGFAIAFFFVALSFVGYKFFLGGNTISADNVNIAITGPVSISAGETLQFGIDVKNNNSVDLSALSYLVEYPDGSRQSSDLSKELKREGKDVGVLKSGADFKKDFKAILFGAENDTKTIKVTIEYRVPGSNAVFHKDKSYDLLINSAPVSITVSGLKEVTSGQTLTFTAEVRSNSTKVIKDLILQATFPFGFNLQKSVPNQAGLNVWNIGDLEPNGVRQLSFTGTMEGQNEEERVFKFVVGLKKANDSLSIGTPFFSSVSSVVIQKPFIGVALSIDGDTSAEYVAEPNKTIRTDVIYKNNLTTKVFDPEIIIKLKGNALNKNYITVNNGYYSSINNTIIFNKTNSQKFESLEPGSTGNLNFTLLTYPFGTITSSNQDITMEVTVSGRREEGGNVPEEVLSTTVKKIKLVSNLKLNSFVTYNTGAFKNVGPIPPKAEKETSYTITWALTNTYNDVGNVIVSANLPSYVRWVGSVSGGENVTYNQIGGEVIWKPSDIKSGTGVNSSPKQVSFQVAIIPSLSQVGSSPDILTNNTVRGTDKFTNTEITDTQENLTTKINGEPNLDSATGNVVE